MTEFCATHPALEYIDQIFGHDPFAGEEDDNVFFFGIHATKVYRDFTGRQVPTTRSFSLMSIKQASSAENLANLLRHEEGGWNIYVSMNPFPAGSPSRLERLVKNVRNLFIESDGGNSLELIEAAVYAGVIPPPHTVLESSPGKYHIVWHVQGFSTLEAKAMLRALANKFGGDPASTDLHRVLRLPGFHNLKYAEKPEVRLLEFHPEVERYHKSEFKIEYVPLQAPDAPITALALKNIIGHIERNADEAQFTLSARQEFGDGYQWEVTCPWALSHTTPGNTALVMLLPDGKPQFNCFHSHCSKRGWSDIRNLWEETVKHPQQFTGELGVPLDAVPTAIGYPDFPAECATPALEEILSASELPPQFMFLTLVTMFGSLAGPKLSLGDPPWVLTGRIYGALLAPPGGYKGSTLDVCKYMLQDKAGIIRPGDGIGSGEALVAELNSGSRACLTWDEMYEFFNKGQIEKSTLFTKVTSLYTQTEASTKRAASKQSTGQIAVNDVWLSLIGGLTPEHWEAAWNHSVGGGLYRRFQLAAVEKSARVPNIPSMVLYNLAAKLRTNLRRLQQSTTENGGTLFPEHIPLDTPQMTDEAACMFEDWAAKIPIDDIYKSLDENAKRVALILAAMNGKDIDAEIAAASIAWGDYQKTLRKLLAPSTTQDRDAACEQLILKHLPDYGKVSWTWLYRRANLSRFGSHMLERVRRAATQEGLISMKQQGPTLFIWKNKSF